MRTVLSTRPAPRPAHRLRAASILACVGFALGCADRPALVRDSGESQDAAEVALLEDLQRRTFDFFWETANPKNGLVPDRYPTPSFSSIAAVGFALTSYGIGVERGYVTRAQARGRVLTTLRFFRDAPQGDAEHGMTGYRGFYYHFLDMDTGARYADVELSTIDTALLLAGVLFCREYFGGPEPEEVEVRALADTLLARAEWTWVSPRAPLVSMGWKPESGFLGHDWVGYDEAMILYLLALASPSHPVDATAWTAWTARYDERWGTFFGQQHLSFPPLFGHQYSHLWVDFRGLFDPYMQRRGLDYFENSRRATLAQRAYAIANPEGFRGYGADVWGLSACDGPGDVIASFGGRPRQFRGYAARGMASYDDGTLAPTAMLSSLPFAPEVVLPGLRALRLTWGDHIYGRYGFLDAFNPSFQFADLARAGKVVPGKGWVDVDYLGIDQGPILGMVENYRSGLVWRVMRGSSMLRAGLSRAGFRGGWLEAAR
ncbi:MAG TPA: glucoamylase family protein [Kofleriaceae bacterium]|nr:glucoamylase family protein [Kofleriaceae bacterium]